MKQYITAEAIEVNLDKEDLDDSHATKPPNSLPDDASISSQVMRAGTKQFSTLQSCLCVIEGSSPDFIRGYN